MTDEPGRSASFQPKEGILDSLGMTQAEFDQAVFDAFLHHKKRDCRSSIHVLPVIIKGRRYLLEEIANVKFWAETAAERQAREKADAAIRNEERLSKPTG
jgi:hypothetical protein